MTKKELLCVAYHLPASTPEETAVKKRSITDLPRRRFSSDMRSFGKWARSYKQVSTSGLIANNMLDVPSSALEVDVKHHTRVPSREKAPMG